MKFNNKKDARKRLEELVAIARSDKYTLKERIQANEEALNLYDSRKNKKKYQLILAAISVKLRRFWKIH
ncbi:hypothetical protein [Eupransor demetentiae]|uniref:Uncharacterized protein n=1 Tax=Eupransor demetentiae TaxID=3109584 RepID=A0ABM9N4Q9_9LACO|nr:hypothetical protein R54876_GBNLAHCA_00716 [Lactobacillaceae bacterium LMG 33000]